MILDMIQGCRHLRRLTDRWTLSKNSTTWLKDSRVWRKAGLYWENFDYNYIHPGSIFIPCHGMTPDGLRAQYLIPNLSWSAIAYPSNCPFRSGHVITQSRKISANSPLAERKQTADREPLCRIFLEKPSFFQTDFFTKLGPQIILLPLPNFGVNRREAHQAKKLDFVDSESEDKGSKESPKNSPPQSPRENRLPSMGDQPQEHKIGELCTPDIIDLPILNLEEIWRPFKIKTSTIRMV
jgi:hypothetical protein